MIFPNSYDENHVVFKRKVTRQIKAIVRQSPGFFKRSTSYLTHGKMLRSSIMESVALRLEVAKKRLYLPAAVLELIHSASIFHDDVIDIESFRRGSKTINSVYKNRLSVMFGDYLLALTLERFAKYSSLALQKDFYSKIKEVCEGEIKQGDFKELKNPPTIEQCFEISRKKTGALFALSFKTPAILSENTSAEITTFAEECGYIYGLIFQLLDDVKDIKNDVFFKKTINEKTTVFKSWSLPSVFWMQKDDRSFKDFLETGELVLSKKIRKEMEIFIKQQIKKFFDEIETKHKTFKNNPSAKIFFEIFKYQLELLNPWNFDVAI